MKKDLLKEAHDLGLEVTMKNTIAEIQEAMNAVALPEINIEIEPIPEQETVSYEDHKKAGFVNLTQSMALQKQGKRVVEIKNIGGFTLHRLEKI